MKFRFFNIRWDTDGEQVNLPKEVTFHAPYGFEPSMEGADYLSDTYGFCVFGFEFEKV